MGFLYLAIKIPQIITYTIITNILSYLTSFVRCTLSHLNLFKSPHDSYDHTSGGAANYILIIDGASPSLLPVPIQVVTTAIKDKVPIICYKDFVSQFGGDKNAICTVCLECVGEEELVRELINCKHVFHQKCLDRWIDERQVNCPLCRSMLLPPKRLLSCVVNPTLATSLDPVA